MRNKFDYWKLFWELPLTSSLKSAYLVLKKQQQKKDFKNVFANLKNIFKNKKVKRTFKPKLKIFPFSNIHFII